MPFLVPIIFTAAFAATAGGIAVGIIFEVVASVAISFVLSSVARALTKKPSGPAFSIDAGNRTVTVRQPVQPWRVIYGTGRYGGTMIFIGLHGPSNEWLHMVIVQAGHKCASMGQMYFDAEPVTIGTDNKAGGRFENHVERYIQLGTDSEPGFLHLQSILPATWTPAHRVLGRCAVHVVLKWNADIFPGGIPNITFDMQGREIFDPRTGITAFSDNAALCLYDYLRDTRLGLKAADDELDDDVNTAAFNICDEAVALKAGGTEKRYTCNGSFDTSQVPADIIPAMLSSMAGRITYSGGKWGIYPGAWRSPVLDITDDDLRGPIRMQTLVSRREIFNGVKGIYVSAANKYQAADFPPVQNPIYVAQDNGEEIWKDIELQFTNSSTMAQRLAKIELERARRQKTIDLQCKLSAFMLQTPDVITITRPHFGFQDKTFEVFANKFAVGGETDAPTLGVDLTVRETDALVYFWNPATDEAAPPPAPVPPKLPGDRFGLLAPVTNIQLASDDTTAIFRNDGVRISRIHVTWDLPADIFVQDGGHIKVEYREATSVIWTPLPLLHGDADEVYISGISDGKNYYVRITAISTELMRSAVATAGPVLAKGPVSTISPAIGKGKFAVVATNTTLHLYWDNTNTSVEITVLKNDSSDAGPFQDDVSVTGLPTPSHLYYCYPYYSFDDDAKGLPPIKFAQVAGGLGVPPIFYDTKSEAAMRELNLSGRTQLMATGSLSFSTTASSTPVTTTKDPYLCPRWGMVVLSRLRGEIEIQDGQPDEEIATLEGDGWTRIRRQRILPCDRFVGIRTHNGGDLEQTCETPMLLARRPAPGADRISRFSTDLHLGDVIMSQTLMGAARWDPAQIVLTEFIDRLDKAVETECYPFHTFLCGRRGSRLLSTHNANPGKDT